MKTRLQGYILGVICVPLVGPAFATNVANPAAADSEYIDTYYEGLWGCEKAFCPDGYTFFPSGSAMDVWQERVKEQFCGDELVFKDCSVVSLHDVVHRHPTEPKYSKMVTKVTFTYLDARDGVTYTDTDTFYLAWPSPMCPPGYALEDQYWKATRPNGSTKVLGTFTACLKMPGANSGRELGGSPAAANASKCMAGDSTFVGNPINTASFNKVERVVDLATPGLRWVRTYNSGATPATFNSPDAIQKPPLARLGAGWRGSFDRSIVPGKAYDPSTAAIVDVVNLLRDDGSFREFRPFGDTYVGETDEVGALTFQGDTWTYAPGDGSVERYDRDGKLFELVDRNGRRTHLAYKAEAGDQVLSEVRDDQGRTLAFTYDAAGRIASVTESDGRRVSYEYSETGASPLSATLTRVYRSDRSYIEYLYTDGQSGAKRTDLLIGIIGPDGSRFATYEYDDDGRAKKTAHAGNAALSMSVKLSVSKVIVADRDGDRAYLTFEPVGGRILPKRFEYLDGSESRISLRDYNDDGTVAKLVDHDGSVTTFQYDPASKLETARTEAVGMPEERTIRTAWDKRWRRPVRVDESTRWTSLAYDDRGNLLDITTGGASDASDPASPAWPDIRRTRMTYDARGSLLSVDGPRTDVDDVTRYSYFDADAPACVSDLLHCDWRKGDLASATSPTGARWQATRYDPAGRLLTWTDANGLAGRVSYDALGRVQESALATTIGKTPIEAIERQEFDKADNLTAVIDADGVRTDLRYDEARRLVGIDLPSGAHVGYTLDARDHRTAITVTDGEGNPAFASKTAYSKFGWPVAFIDADGKVTKASRDEKGRLTSLVDPLLRTTAYTYDGLGRMSRQAVDTQGIAATSNLIYDSLDLLRGVDDPKGLRTDYLRNGLGDLLWQRSPDTGESTFGNDMAGSLTMSATAEGRVARHTYDAGNRIVETIFGEGAPQGYMYDVAPAICDAPERFPIGRLSRVSDASGTSEYCYDSAGRVTRKIQSTAKGSLTVRYGYSLAGRQTSMTYPDSSVVTYRRNGAGQVAAVALDHPMLGKQSLLNTVTWSPLEAPLNWTYGSGRTLGRAYDLNGRTTAVFDSRGDGLTVTYGHDAAGQIVQLIEGGTTVDWTYDNLGRLTQAMVGNVVRQKYTYDATGNRLSFANIAGSLSYAYPADNHRLSRAGSSARRYDRDGNTTILDDKTFTYDANGRMATVSLGGQLAMTYQYNAWGEQVIRQHKDGTTVAVYDESGHWIGDYTADGKTLRQAIWLDDFPVALIENGKLYDIETDHLGTPRAVVDRSRDTVVWTWAITGEAFGADAPNYDPDGDGKAFMFDMRFAGQRFDPVTELNYNYRRDYDPTVGRYVQSDPIGLFGGQDSTYAYVDAKPLSHVDPFGLRVLLCSRPVDIDGIPSGLRPLLKHNWIKTDKYEAGMGGACPVPGQGCADVPYTGTETKDHSGQSQEPGAICEEQRNVDEACVNGKIAPGQPTGSWNPMNQCQSFANSVIGQCRYAPQMSPAMSGSVKPRGPLGSRYSSAPGGYP